MLTNNYHIQHVYCTILVGVLAYPAYGAYLATLLTDSDHVKYIHSSIRIRIPVSVLLYNSDGDIFGRNQTAVGDLEVDIGIGTGLCKVRCP